MTGVAYDAEGRLLCFETDGRRTTLSERESDPSNLEALGTAIVQALAARARRLVRHTAAGELLEVAVSRFRV